MAVQLCDTNYYINLDKCNSKAIFQIVIVISPVIFWSNNV